MTNKNFKEIFDNLSLNQSEALIQFCELVIEWHSNSSINKSEYHKITALIVTLAGKNSITLPNYTDDTSPENRCVGYATHLIKTRGKILELANIELVSDDVEYILQRGSNSEFGYAFLTSEEKKSIHAKAASIRKTIESSNLKDAKKNALYSRLSEFLKEVDLVGTKTDRIFAFVGDLTMVAVEMHESAKPMIKDFKEILSIVMKSRAKNEGVQLPNAEQMPELPTPDNSAE